MECLKIKPEYQSAVIGFNGSGLPLGMREDIHLLAEMALHDKNLQKFFVRMPEANEIAAYKEELFLKNHPVTPPVQVVQETEEVHQPIVITTPEEEGPQ